MQTNKAERGSRLIGIGADESTRRRQLIFNRQTQFLSHSGFVCHEPYAECDCVTKHNPVHQVVIGHETVFGSCGTNVVPSEVKI